MISLGFPGFSLDDMRKMAIRERLYWCTRANKLLKLLKGPRRG